MLQLGGQLQVILQCGNRRLRSDLFVVFTMSLCALGLKQLLISLLFKSYGFDIKCTRSQKLFEANL